MPKLSGEIDGELITREFFPDYVGKEDDINCGNCYRWAYIAYLLYEGVDLYSVDSWYGKFHAFPYQRGRFFDSESPSGEDSLEDLRCNRICEVVEEDCVVHDEKEFIEFWNRYGRYKFADAPDIRNQVRNFWRRYNRRQKK